MKELNHTIHGTQIILLEELHFTSLQDIVIIISNHQKNIRVLESIEDSPQLPYGYPTSILISFFPPLWFRIMNPLVEHHMGYSN